MVPAGYMTAALLIALCGCAVPGIIILHDPLSSPQHTELGTIYESAGKPALAMREYREAVRKDSTALKPLMRLAELSYRRGDLDTAAVLYERVLEQAPHDGDALNNLAWVLIEAGEKLDRAREVAARAAALDTTSRPWYLDTLGVVLLMQGEAREAVLVLSEAVATMPAGRSELNEVQRHLEAARTAAAVDGPEREGQARAN
jgi:Tfp pilus assembly protein PilF